MKPEKENCILKERKNWGKKYKVKAAAMKKEYTVKQMKIIKNIWHSFQILSFYYISEVGNAFSVLWDGILSNRESTALGFTAV